MSRNRQGVPRYDLVPDVIGPSIIRHRGNLSMVARELKCSRDTILDRVNKSPELKQLLFSTRESALDDLETSAFDRALAGDTILTIFLLKTKGWSRGYVERKSIDVSLEKMEGEKDDNDTMTLERWKAQQQKNIAQVEATMALFDEVYEDDDDPLTIDAEFTKTV